MSPQVTRDSATHFSGRRLTFSKVRHNGIKFPQITMKTFIVEAIVKAVLFILMLNKFILLKINGRNMNKRSAEFNCHLTKAKEENVYKICCFLRLCFCAYPGHHSSHFMSLGTTSNGSVMDGSNVEIIFLTVNSPRPNLDINFLN
jgi:hypothetical protein